MKQLSGSAAVQGCPESCVGGGEGHDNHGSGPGNPISTMCGERQVTGNRKSPRPAQARRAHGASWIWLSSLLCSVAGDRATASHSPKPQSNGTPHPPCSQETQNCLSEQRWPKKHKLCVRRQILVPGRTLARESSGAGRGACTGVGPQARGSGLHSGNGGCRGLRPSPAHTSTFNNKARRQSLEVVKKEPGVQWRRQKKTRIR